MTMNIRRFLKSLSGIEGRSLAVLLAIAIAALYLDTTLLPAIPAALSWLAIVLALAAAVRWGAGRADAEREGRSTELELAAIAANLEEGLVVYDPSFRIVSLNPAAERIFGVSNKDAAGRTIEPRLAADPRYGPLTQVIFPSLAPSVDELSEANAWPVRVRVVLEHPDLRLSTTLNRVMDERGGTVFFVKLVRDETREQAILASKNEFINTAAHQLRTPLTAINWALENIKKSAEGVSDEIGMTANEALGVSERALKITNDLLDVAKIEDGRFGYQFEDGDLVGFVNDVTSSLLPVAKQYGVAVSFSHDGIPSLPVRIDKSRLGLALFNLIDNAIKYNVKNGTVEIVLARVPDRPFAKVSVKDSGVGIPEDERQKIFKKFHRGTNVTQLEPNGNGLGLFITRNIVKQHGGDIGFESNIDRGSTFWFTVPLETRFIPQKEFVHEDAM